MLLINTTTTQLREGGADNLYEISHLFSELIIEKKAHCGRNIDWLLTERP